ncbi:hypothetical protein QWZ03_11235 [Chitinimonas viridis]|uniref:Uncharacterized protein n=1 Tax=Chitinimonas viridis TaxID=664880 RepID=A0ABT8B5P1_9NEIS|nr:hypothetical protein [Chitinimonas viridis]MDN3577339.1 hypothetical protein [Chitinimonas viridis]
MVYPVEDVAVAEVATPSSTVEVVAAPVSSQPATPPLRTAVAPAGQHSQVAMPAMAANPFAPRNWQAPPLPVVTPAPVVVAPALQVEPAGPPPLPFKFMGRLHDGGEQVVYLSQGEQTLIARVGETLGATYKVLGLDAQRIEFEYLPTGDKQQLALPASE